MKWRFRDETRVLDDAARASAPGSFIALSDGMTHYELAGPGDGLCAVLIHGFSVPYFIWDPAFTALVHAGIQVLRYDLYGRGYSDRPDVCYDQALFVRQLAELLEGLQITRPVNLAGLSLGGAIAVGFADLYPDCVGRLALIAPAGMPLSLPVAARLLALLVFGEVLVDHFAERLLVSSLARDPHTRASLPRFEAQYRAQMPFIGLRRALLSTLRYGPMEHMGEVYRRVGAHPRPVLLIWGKDDRTIPFIGSGAVLAALPKAQFHPIEHAGHIPHYEQPEAVNPLLIKFLQSRSGQPAS